MNHSRLEEPPGPQDLRKNIMWVFLNFFSYKCPRICFLEEVIKKQQVLTKKHSAKVTYKLKAKKDNKTKKLLDDKVPLPVKHLEKNWSQPSAHRKRLSKKRPQTISSQAITRHNNFHAGWFQKRKPRSPNFIWTELCPFWFSC